MAAECKCPKCPPEGAPAWMLTFGDMMSLLLTFFIMLLSLSEIKKEDEYRAIVKEVKKAFGMHGGGGRVPSKDDPELTFIERIKAMQLVSRKLPSKSNTKDPGTRGREQQVTIVRPGERQIVGTRITFEPGSDKLGTSQHQRLIELADRIRGLNTKIEMAGHADTGEPFDPDRFRDLMDLSTARARAVRQYLISDACKLRSVRLRVVGNGDSEKLKHDVYDSNELRTNRRVEIFKLDTLVEELAKPEMSSSG